VISLSNQPQTTKPEFRTCQSCGNSTPADEPLCAYCGQPSAEAIAAHEEEFATRQFVIALVARANPFTMILIGANVAIFLVEWVYGGMGIMSTDVRVLVALGAKQNALVIGGLQYWRLITCMFLHIGFLHLLFNNYALWIIGQEIEKLYGSARFVVLYVVTGVLASVCSLVLSPEAVSAGASGAIFGLFGVLGTFAFRYRREIPSTIGKSIRSRVLPIIALNLFIGFQTGIVDNAAHVGGLVSGVILALVVPYKRLDERETPIFWRSLQIACLTAVALSLILAFRNFAVFQSVRNGRPRTVSRSIFDTTGMAVPAASRIQITSSASSDVRCIIV